MYAFNVNMYTFLLQQLASKSETRQPPEFGINRKKALLEMFPPISVSNSERLQQGWSGRRPGLRFRCGGQPWVLTAPSPAWEGQMWCHPLEKYKQQAQRMSPFKSGIPGCSLWWGLKSIICIYRDFKRGTRKLSSSNGTKPSLPARALLVQSKGQGTDLRLDGFKHGYVH